jgi:hypothetical protein
MQDPLKQEMFILCQFATKYREYVLKFYSDSWCILSSKYGFVFPDELIPANYEARFGDPTSNTISMKNFLRKQGRKTYIITTVI